MRYMVQPHSIFEVPRAGPRYDREPPIRIDNPTDRAIMVTIEAPEVVGERATRDLINQWLAMPPPLQAPRAIFSTVAIPQTRFIENRGIGVQAETAEQMLARQIELARLIERFQAPMRPLWEQADQPPETAEQVHRRLELDHLERRMRERNWEIAQAQALRDTFGYQAYLDREGTERATRRSLEFLLEHLTPEQRQSWGNFSSFKVKGNVSGAMYFVSSGGVMRESDRHEFCLQLAGDEWTPVYDAVLARKILIECDESTFLGTANNLTVGNPERPRRQRGGERIQPLDQNTSALQYSAGAMARLTSWMRDIGSGGAGGPGRGAC